MKKQVLHELKFRLIINYYLFVIRILFILICIFFLACSLDIVPVFSGNTFENSLVGRIIVGTGMTWGIYSISMALYIRTKTFSIIEGNISIRYLLRNSKRYYAVKDIKRITIGTSYDNSLWSKGIKIVFKNNDAYEFVHYDYLNFSAFRKTLEELRKVYEVSYL